jgi:ferrous iron transport protein B
MHGHSDKNARPPAAGSRRLALVGNPNVGKSVIFGVLTGTYATVSNYPGTTVEVSRGEARIKGESVTVIDAPGVNSLIPMSEDERVTRDILLNEPMDGVLLTIDAKNLKRGLGIAVQLAEMGLPFSMALNMYDEAGERGIRIDVKALSTAIGVEVVPTIATQRWGMDDLRKSLSGARRSSVAVSYPDAVEDGITRISGFLPEACISRRAMAVMVLAGDATLSEWLSSRLSAKDMEAVLRARDEAQAAFPVPLGYFINKLRLQEADRIVDSVQTKERTRRKGVAAVLGRASMDPLLGLPVLVVVLFIMYEFVGKLGAGVFVDFLEDSVFGAYLNPWAGRVVGLLVGTGFIYDLLVGPYGLITMAMTYAVAIVLPIVGCFFVFFGILEDSGYLPRLAVMVDRVFKMMGLNGKAVLPMVLGLGCDTMATMTTRILETKKERVLVTLLLALGVPCSAQLGVILGMLGAVSLLAAAVWAFVVLLVIFLVGYLAAKVVPGERSDFILEIPPMRVPKMSNIALKTLVRVEWYLKEAVPLFIAGTLFLFALDRLDALEALENAAAPIIKDFLGLPVEATEAFIVGFLRRDYGAAGLLALQNKGMLDPTQVVVSLVTMTLFIPCIANFFMIIKERGLKAAILIMLFIFPFALLAGGVLNFVLRFLNLSL